MSKKLITHYLEEHDNLDHIRAICHWASKEEKQEYLSVASLYDMVSFTEAINDNVTVHVQVDRDNKNGRITHKFTQELPYGKAFLVSFAEVDNKCTIYC